MGNLESISATIGPELPQRESCAFCIYMSKVVDECSYFGWRSKSRKALEANSHNTRLHPESSFQLLIPDTVNTAHRSHAASYCLPAEFPIQVQRDTGSSQESSQNRQHGLIVQL